MSEGTSTSGHGMTQGLGERETHSIAEESCVKGCMPRRQGQSGALVEDSTHREILEIGTANEDG